MNAVPCEARHASPNARRVASINHRGNSKRNTFYPKPDATCKERMQHARKGCSMQGKDATCKERMQHATKGCNMQDKDATCKTRMQHAACTRTDAAEAGREALRER
jgi:hypothetical protein